MNFPPVIPREVRTVDDGIVRLSGPPKTAINFDCALPG
jgi:hypothetical protein